MTSREKQTHVDKNAGTFATDRELKSNKNKGVEFFISKIICWWVEYTYLYIIQKYKTSAFIQASK